MNTILNKMADEEIRISSFSLLIMHAQRPWKVCDTFGKSEKSYKVCDKKDRGGCPPCESILEYLSLCLGTVWNVEIYIFVYGYCMKICSSFDSLGLVSFILIQNHTKKFCVGRLDIWLIFIIKQWVWSVCSFEGTRNCFLLLQFWEKTRLNKNIWWMQM